MIGLRLTNLSVTDNPDGSKLATFILPGRVAEVVFTEGISSLVYAFIFNMLSRYNPETLVGSSLLELIAAPILNQQTIGLVEVLINDELADLTSRFKTLQDRADFDIPPQERLQRVQVDGIDFISGQSQQGIADSATVRFSIFNDLNQRISVAL